MHTHSNMRYLLLFHYNNGFVNAPQCYVTRTLPVLPELRTVHHRHSVPKSLPSFHCRITGACTHVLHVLVTPLKLAKTHIPAPAASFSRLTRRAHAQVRSVNKAALCIVRLKFKCLIRSS
jgi:hypothetical protein